MLPKRQATREPRPAKQLALFVAIYALLVVAVVAAISRLTEDPPSGDIPRRIEAARRIDDNQELAVIYKKLLAREPGNIDYHYAYCHAVDQLTGSRNEPGPSQRSQAVENYQKLATAADPHMSDIGFYGLGLLESLDHRYEGALLHFDRVKDRGLKYLNNSAGYVLARLRRTEEAEACFHKEIEVGGNLEGAMANCLKLLQRQRRFGEMIRLSEDPRLKPLIPAWSLRVAYLAQGKAGLYLRLLPGRLVESAGWVSVVGALAGALVWYFYLRRLDVFEAEKHRYALAAMGGGAVCAMGSLVLYDLMAWGGVDQPSSWWGEFAYSVFAIGLNEEFIKFIPFLLLWFLSRQANESVDYVVYASLCALGFATLENVLYYGGNGVGIMVGRTTVSAVLHMTDSSIVAYGIILAKYRRWGRLRWNVPGFLLLAALFHGLFDYPLISETLDPAFKELAFPIILVGFALYGKMLNNALTQSEFFDEAAATDLSKLRSYLWSGLVAVILLEYALVAREVGPTLAIKHSAHVFFGFMFLIFLVGNSIGVLNPKRKGWVPLLEEQSRLELEQATPNGTCLEVYLNRTPGKVNARAEIIQRAEPLAEAGSPQMLRRLWVLQVVGFLLNFVLVLVSFLALVLALTQDISSVFWNAVGMAAGVVGAVACMKIDLVSFWDNRLRKRLAASLTGGNGASSGLREADVEWIELVPPKRWGKAWLEAPRECGLLKVDWQGRLLNYEGIRQRGTIPADSIISIRTVRCSSHPMLYVLVDLEAMTDKGIVHFPMRRCGGSMVNSQEKQGTALAKLVAEFATKGSS